VHYSYFGPFESNGFTPVVPKVGGEAEIGDWGAVKQKWVVGGR